MVQQLLERNTRSVLLHLDPLRQHLLLSLVEDLLGRHYPGEVGLANGHLCQKPQSQIDNLGHLVISGEII